MRKTLGVTLPIVPAASWKRALLLYPSQAFCPDPSTRPVVIRTQLLKLHSYLRSAGIPEVQIIDLELELGRPIDEAELKEFLDDALRLIGPEPYDFIGISCYTSVSYTATLEIARALRRVQPDSVIAVGGYHCLASADDFDDVPAIDYVVQGDGVAFLAALMRGEELPRIVSFGGAPVDPTQIRYEEYPYRYVRQPGVAHVQLSKGCPFTCAFCCEPFVGNSRYVPMAVEEAIDEIDLVIRTLNPDKILIEDLIFGFNAHWRYEFLAALRDRNYPQIFWVEMRADTITEQTAELMGQQNFDVTIGLESASPSTLGYMKKARDPASYIRSFRRSAELLQRAGVPTTFSIMLNFPGETLTSFRETITQCEEVLSGTDAPFFRFDFFEYSFYPGNETYATIAQLSAELGTEINDRHWYQLRDGRMLDQAICSTPSRQLRQEVGRGATRTYFKDAVERIKVRQEQGGQMRSRLFWNYDFAMRFIRYCQIQDVNIFKLRLTADESVLATAALALADTHRHITAQILARLQATRADTWQLRQAIWEASFDWIVQQVDSGALSRVSCSGVEGIAAEFARTGCDVLLSRLEASGVARSRRWKEFL
jgi:radical SAM superfamily enzyme YgiQ (UPF0313 family)